MDWNWSHAEALLQTGLAISPDDEYLLAYQARMASIRGDTDTAIALSMPLVERRVTEARLHYTLGHHYYRAGRYHEAVDSYRDALKLSPEQPDAHTWALDEFVPFRVTPMRHCGKWLSSHTLIVSFTALLSRTPLPATSLLPAS